MTNTTPQSTADIVFANSTAANQVQAILSGKLPFPSNGKAALCLFGTYGTGKTTYSQIFCREFEKAVSNSELASKPHFVSCQKSEAINSVLKTCESMTKVLSFNESGRHYFIFDEVDNLTDNAQRALKAFLNTPDVVCVLTTNYLDKLDKGLLDRCYCVNFNAGPPDVIRARVKQVLQNDGLMLDDARIDRIIEDSDGSWREILPIAEMLATPVNPPPRSKFHVVK